MMSPEQKASAEMLCDHEVVLATQYSIDQLQQYRSIRRQDNRMEMMSPMEFDKTDQMQQHLCDANVISRGFNNALRNKPINEIYLRPCNIPTFQNNLKCGTKKCCTMHQTFNNHTRAGTGVAVGSAVGSAPHDGSGNTIDRKLYR
jgi:hypothetical protein